MTRSQRSPTVASYESEKLSRNSSDCWPDQTVFGPKTASFPTDSAENTAPGVQDAADPTHMLPGPVRTVFGAPKTVLGPKAITVPTVSAESKTLGG